MIAPKKFPHEPKSTLLLEGPAGIIEALSTYPNSPKGPSALVIICHPHPLFGGNFTNKVVSILARSFQSLELATLRFNFRGVGLSEGIYDKGIGETEDVNALFDWIHEQFPNQAIWLAGFSFGAYVAACAAKNRPVKKLICVAPPIENFPFKTLPPFSCPWILIQGDKDEIVSPQAVFQWVSHLSQPPQLIKISDATHFFHGKLLELQNNLLMALKKTDSL